MSLPSTRREFLRLLGTAGVVSLSGGVPGFLARAAETAAVNSCPGILVLIQLAGGNDGLNSFIPFADDAYHKARPGIGIPRNQVLTINEQFGLHPRLTGLKELFDDGKLAIAQGVGYPHPDRSHFRSMDIWQSATPDLASPRDGWLGRALEWQFDQNPALAEGLTLGTEKLPLAFVSGRVMVPTLRRVEDFQLLETPRFASNQARKRAYLDRTVATEAPAVSEIDFLRRSMRNALVSADRLKSLGAAYKPSVDYPTTALANRLKLVAQMIVAELPSRMYFVSLDGFDTHAQQEGGHAALLGELGGAMRAFEQDLKGHGLSDRVLVSTFSEFGRRVAENGSLGTDHGAASVQFVMTPDRPGLYGRHPSLTDLDDGDLKYTVDFRSLYATFLKWLRIPAEPVLGAGFDPMGFV